MYLNEPLTGKYMKTWIAESHIDEEPKLGVKSFSALPRWLCYGYLTVLVCTPRKKVISLHKTRSLSSFPCSVNLSSLGVFPACYSSFNVSSISHPALHWCLTFLFKVNKLLCDLTATFCLDALPGNVPLTFTSPPHTLYIMCIRMARQLNRLYSAPRHLCIKFTIPRSTAYGLTVHVKITSGKTSLDCLCTYHICPNLTKYHTDNKKKETEVEEKSIFCVFKLALKYKHFLQCRSWKWLMLCGYFSTLTDWSEEYL